MALTARELIFYIRATNQASGAIGRVIADLTALNKATDLANKQQLAAARQQTAGVRVSAAQRDLQAVKQNLPAQQGILAAQAMRQKLSDSQFASGTKELGQQRQLFDLQTRRMQLEQKMAQIVPADANAGFSDAQLAQMEIYDRQLTSIGMQEAVVTRNQEALAVSTERLGAAYAAALAEQRRLQAAVNFGQVDPVALEAAQAKVNLAQAQYGSAVGASEQLARAQRAQSIEQLQKYAGAIDHIGRTAQIAGAVTVAAFAAMAIGAAKAQSQIVLAATQSTVPGKNSTAQVLANARYIQNQILAIQKSGRSTATQAEQSASAYDIFSSVSLPGNQLKQLQEGTQLLKQFNTVATANYGQVSLQQVTKAGTVIMNNFHTSVAQMPAALNTMQAAVRFGSLTMGQFVSTFNTVAPSFKAAGYSFTAMAQNVAAISRYFPNIATGAVGLARLTDTFGRYAADFKAWGVTITDVNGKLLPLNEIIGKIIAKQPGLAKGGTALQAFLKDVTGNAGTSQARKLFVTYAENLPQIDALMKQVKGDNNELSKSFTAMQKSPGVQWVEFTNQLKALAYEIGIYAIPALIQLGKPIASAVKWFDQLSPSTQASIAKFGVFGGAALLLTGTFLKLASMAVRVVGAMKLIAGEQGVSGLIGAFATAEKRANLFYKSMILIRNLGEISVVIGLSFVVAKGGELLAQFLGKQQGLQNFAHKYLGTGIGDQSFNSAGNQKTINNILNAAKNGTITATEMQDIQSMVNRGIAPASFLKQVQGLMAKNSEAIPMPGTPSRVNVPNNLTGGITAGDTATQAQKWNTLFEAVKKAQALVAANPQSLKDAQAYYDALDKLQKASTGNQFQAAEAVLGYQKSATTKLASAHKKALDEQKTFNNDLKSLRTRDNQTIKDAFDITGGPAAGLDKIKTLAKKIQDELNDATSKSQLTAINVQVETLKKMEANQKKAIDDLKTYQATAVQDMQQVYTNFLQANQQAFGTLFQGPFMQGPAFQNMTQWGLVNQFGQATPRPSDILKDLQSQLGQFHAFRGGLSTLKNRGLPAGLLAQIEQQGTAAVPDIQALEQMSKKQIAQYVKDWQQGQKMITQATQADFKPEIAKWKTYGKQIATAIAAGIDEGDFTIFKNLKSEILKDLRTTPTPVGHGKHPTQHITENQKKKEPKVTAEYHYHVHGVEDMRGARTELKHMHFRNRNSILI